MGWVAAAGAGVAVWTLVPRPARGLRQLTLGRRSATIPGRFTGVALLLIVLALAGSAAGIPLPFLLLAGVATGTTCVLGLQARQRKRIREEAERVARACQVFAGQLRTGRIPLEALVVAAEDCPSLVPVVSAHRIGADVTQALRSVSARPGAAGLAALAAAWRLAERSGAPMAGAAEQVSAQLAERARLRRAVAAELAPARATGKLLAALPLVGITMGFLVGGQPDEFLLMHPLGRWCLMLGISLACLGVLWTEFLAERVERQAR